MRVTVTEPTVFLGLIGVNEVRAHATATADLIRGISTGEPR